MNLKKRIASLLNDNQKSRIKELSKYSPKEIIKDIKADFKLARIIRSNRECTGRIRVGFIVQMAEIWDKESPIYDAMATDDSFSPTLIVVPPYNFVNKSVEKSYNDNFFLDHYPDAIKALVGGQWIDLEEMKFDYVFFQRPYDHYLPAGFRSGDVAKHSKVCYIPYGFSGADVFNDGNTNKYFFRNVYFSFLESDSMVKLLKNKFSGPIERRLHRIVNLGYPALIPYFSVEYKRTYDDLVWTPRWSFDPVIGGSNYLKYKDIFIELAERYKDKSFTFRPHPLMFDEVQAKGLMSASQIDEYKERCIKNGVYYDSGRPIYETFCDADILVTDFSTIIIQFFITGKPIVYCDSGLELNELYTKLSAGFYTVKNGEELSTVVEQLLNGDDSLFEKRRQIINEELQLHKTSTKEIIQCIKEDAFKQRRKK